MGEARRRGTFEERKAQAMKQYREWIVESIELCKRRVVAGQIGTVPLMARQQAFEDCLGMLDVCTEEAGGAE